MPVLAFMCASLIVTAPPTPLIDAAGRGDLGTVRALLSRKAASVDERDASNGFTTLMWAANAGNVELVRLLLAHRADVNASDSFGQTALFLAMSKPIKPTTKSLEAMTTTVRVLLEAGAKVNAQLRAVAGMPQGVTPLRYAVATEPELVALLVEHGANVNVMDQKGVTPLMAAVDQRWGPTTDDAALKNVRFLLDHGAVIDAPVGSITPLMMALWHSFTRTATLLIERGASLTPRSNNGTTMLMFASRAGMPELVQRILSGAGDVNQRNSDGDSALFFALLERSDEPSRGRARAIVKQLLDKGAEPKAPNRAGQSPLMLAAGSGDAQLFELLLAKGGDTAAQDGVLATPLMHAAGGGNPAILRKLLGLRLNPHAQDKDGDTPLHWAAARRRPEAIELLLSTGANINAKNARGRTPLSLATHCTATHAVTTVRLLLERGAEPGDVLAEARGCDTPELQTTVLEALANRAYRAAPTAPLLEALVWTSAPSSAELAQASEGLGALLSETRDLVHVASGFPQVVDNVEAPELGPGAHLVVGYCPSGLTAATLPVWRGLWPKLRVVRVATQLDKNACPVTLFAASAGTQAVQQMEGGGTLLLSAYHLQRPTFEPHTHFRALLFGADGRLLAHTTMNDFKYPRYCKPPHYEEAVAREPQALRLILSCHQAEVHGRPIGGRVADTYRLTHKGDRLALDAVETWSPPD